MSELALPGSAAAGRLRLRPSVRSDLDFVVQVETDSHKRPFITPSEPPQRPPPRPPPRRS